MSRGENSDSIPVDLIFEIVSTLPAKSVGRFRCVCKLWAFILGSQDLTELFLTRSSTRPCLLFGVKEDGEWFFFTSPQLQNPYEKSSIVVAANFYTKFSKDTSDSICSYTSGLIYLPDMWISKAAVRVICNPITGQYAILPLLRNRESRSFLGLDPIDKRFKVLLMYDNEKVSHIVTLGTDKVRWRKIKCPYTHESLGQGICINGILYYLAHRSGHVIVCFDVRLEKFKFLPVERFDGQLVNCNGKLGVINLKYGHDGGFPIHLHMCVLEIVDEKIKLSKYVYALSDKSNVVKVKYNLSVIGMTATGDIVLSTEYASKRFYLFYFNPAKYTLQRVEIHGNHEVLENHNKVYAFVDHVEDLMFNNIMKTSYGATSISPPEQKWKPTSTSTPFKEDHLLRTVSHLQQDRRTFESYNKFNALCLHDDESTGVKT